MDFPGILDDKIQMLSTKLGRTKSALAFPERQIWPFANNGDKNSDKFAAAAAGNDVIYV